MGYAALLSVPLVLVDAELYVRAGSPGLPTKLPPVPGDSDTPSPEPRADTLVSQEPMLATDLVLLDKLTANQDPRMDARSF